MPRPSIMLLPLLRVVLRPPAKRASELIAQFAPEPGDARTRLQGVVTSFLDGYQRALASNDVAALQVEIEEKSVTGRRGFSFEGAAMGLRLLDAFTRPARRRTPAFLRGPGARHDYLIHVGIGWGQARLPGDTQRGLADLDPLLRPLAYDGLGFHEGFFQSERYHERRELPRLSPQNAAAFDQGLGRCLWFVSGAKAERAAERMERFAPRRRPDLWSGLGLAVTYAGGASDAELEGLRSAAGEHAKWFEQGAAFAVAARVRGDDPAQQTAEACRALLGASPESVARYVEGMRTELESRGVGDGTYEEWRTRVAHGLGDAVAKRGEASDVRR